jgi:hypothetical protein
MLKEDLVEIVERASTVEERLGGDFTPAGGNEAVVDERLEAWCQALGKGDWDRLERRLAYDGLDLGGSCRTGQWRSPAVSVVRQSSDPHRAGPRPPRAVRPCSGRCGRRTAR